MTREIWSNLLAKLQDVDLRVILILLFIAVSTGHVGRLFADREAIEQKLLGYVFALGLDAALALSMYEAGRAQERAHRLLALIGFVVACGISGGFNVYYYRLFYPEDPVLLSALLGWAAPVLAAFFGLLRGQGDVQRREEKSQLELEKFKLELEADQQKALLLEKERTKQERELTKRLAMQAQVEAKARQEAETEAQKMERQRRELANLGKSAEILQAIREMPEISKEELGQRFKIGQRTVNYHLAKLEQSGAISRNGDQIRLLWELAELEKEDDQKDG
jgi:DNA-binding transcriptional ArsR family regulator